MMKQIFSINRWCTVRNCIWVCGLNSKTCQTVPHRAWICLRGGHQAVDQWHVLLGICHLSHERKLIWWVINIVTWSRMQTWILFAWHSRGPCWHTKSHPPVAFWENFQKSFNLFSVYCQSTILHLLCQMGEGPLWGSLGQNVPNLETIEKWQTRCWWSTNFRSRHSTLQKFGSS